MNPPPDDTRRPGVLVELVFLLLWFLLFTRLDAAVGKDLAAADANALALQSIERAVHIDIELDANGWLAGNLVLGHLATYLYRLYYVVVAGVLLWVYVRHADVYRRVRRTPGAAVVAVPADHGGGRARHGQPLRARRGGQHRPADRRHPRRPRCRGPA